MNSSRKKLKDIKYLLYFVTHSFMISIFVFVAFIGLAFFLYYGDLLVTQGKGNNKSPLFGAYVIVSQSMVPTIKINDAIVIKRMDNDMYKVGDIITFASTDDNYSGKAVTHRIINKRVENESESLYTTKGDNNNVADPTLVKTDSIYGKVLFKIPSIGRLQGLVSTPIHFFISLLIPAILLLVYDFSRIFVLMSKRKS